MNTNFKFIGLFLLLFTLGAVGANLYGVFAYLPVVGYVIYTSLFTPSFGRRSIEDKAEIWKERALSFLRLAIQAIGILTVLTGFGINIPYIDAITEALNFLADNIGTVSDALVQVVGIFITLYGFFVKSERFEQRGTLLKDYKLE
jgi:hypothetical protein